jgi:CRISPR-associated protein Cas1
MQLYLDSFGTSLTVHSGMFKIRTPAGTEKLLAVREVNAILLSRGVHLSTDVLALSIKEDIPVLLIDDIGHPVGHFWSGRYGSISTIRKRQAAWCDTPDARIWVRALLHRKIDQQRQMIRKFQEGQPDNHDLAKTAAKAMPAINFILGQLAEWAPAHETDAKTTLDLFRGWEGTAGRHYWKTLSAALPESWRFAERSAHPAKDPFNALLNYGYGVLYTQVELSLLKAGLDPAMGVLHADQYNKPTLVYDFIESYRWWVDEVVVQLCLNNIVPFGGFDRFETDGSVWLNAQAKNPLLDALLEFMEKPVYDRKKQFQRRTTIDLDAQKLASLLKKSKPI